MIRFYEEYETTSEKRAAQRGATLRQPTGKARAFILVDNREQSYLQGVVTVFQQAPGCPGPCPAALTVDEMSLDFLRHKCRMVGRRYLPDGWKKALFDYYKLVEKGGRLYDIEDDDG